MHDIITLAVNSNEYKELKYYLNYLANKISTNCEFEFEKRLLNSFNYNKKDTIFKNWIMEIKDFLMISEKGTNSYNKSFKVYLDGTNKIVDLEEAIILEKKFELHDTTVCHFFYNDFYGISISPEKLNYFISFVFNLPKNLDYSSGIIVNSYNSYKDLVEDDFNNDEFINKNNSLILTSLKLIDLFKSHKNTTNIFFDLFFNSQHIDQEYIEYIKLCYDINVLEYIQKEFLLDLPSNFFV